MLRVEPRVQKQFTGPRAIPVSTSAGKARELAHEKFQRSEDRAGRLSLEAPVGAELRICPAQARDTIAPVGEKTRRHRCGKAAEGVSVLNSHPAHVECALKALRGSVRCKHRKADDGRPGRMRKLREESQGT